MLASKKQSYIVDLDWDVADMSSSDCWDALHWSWEEWKRIRGDYVAHRRRRSSREPTSFIPLLNWILNTTVYKSLWLTRSDWEGHTHTHTHTCESRHVWPLSDEGQRSSHTCYMFTRPLTDTHLNNTWADQCFFFFNVKYFSNFTLDSFYIVIVFALLFDDTCGAKIPHLRLRRGTTRINEIGMQDHDFSWPIPIADCFTSK